MSILASSVYYKNKNIIISDNLEIEVPCLFELNHTQLKNNLAYSLCLLGKTNNIPSIGHSYIKDSVTGLRSIHYLTNKLEIKARPDDNYTEGFNCKNLNDTKKYRFRGLFIIGYRYTKKDEYYMADSFFLELITSINDSKEYLSYSICEEEPFTLDKMVEEIDHPKQIIDSFIIKFCLNDCTIKTLNSKNGYCVDISNIITSSKNIISSAIILINTSKDEIISYETYIAFEAKNNNLFVYVYEPIKDNSLGVESMLNGKCKRIQKNEEKELQFKKVLTFPLKDFDGTFKLSNEDTFNLNFVYRGEGHHSGTCFTLPYTIDNYISSVTGSINYLTGVFLFLRPMLIEKSYSFDSKVKWVSERITDEAVLSDSNLLTYTENKSYKASDVKYLCKTHGLSMNESKVHLVKIRASIPLPEC